MSLSGRDVDRLPVTGPAVDANVVGLDQQRSGQGHDRRLVRSRAEVQNVVANSTAESQEEE